MRKIIVLILVSLLMGGTAFAARGDATLNANATRGSQISPGIGTKFQPGHSTDPTKSFRLVRYVPPECMLQTGILSAERIVIWNTDGLSGDDGLTVTIADVTGDSRVAGILATNALTLTPDRITYTGASRDVNERNWAWLQTYGIAEVYVGNVAVVAGDILACAALSSDATMGGAIYWRPVSYLKATGGDEDPVSNQQGNAGFFMDDSAANAENVQVFLKCE